MDKAGMYQEKSQCEVVKPPFRFSCAAATRPKRGFTLVELLVVIGVIGLLLSLLLPALAAARHQALMVNEMAASHELIQAYTLYETDHKGWLIPGFIDSNAGKYQLLVVSDSYGNPLDKPAADRWPWRLAPYVKHQLKGSILVNDMAPLANRDGWDVRAFPALDWSYAVSLYPSFGMNLRNVGGNLLTTALNQEGWIQKASQARQASRLIVFASSHTSAAIRGNYEIVPPVWLQSGMQLGHPVTVANVWESVLGYSDAKAAGYWGYVDPRWDGRAVVACLDGHSELLTLKELCDMTRWSNAAQAAGNPNWGRSDSSDPNWVH